jgi:hypothetical protein
MVEKSMRTEEMKTELDKLLSEAEQALESAHNLIVKEGFFTEEEPLLRGTIMSAAVLHRMYLKRFS